MGDLGGERVRGKAPRQNRHFRQLHPHRQTGMEMAWSAAVAQEKAVEGTNLEDVPLLHGRVQKRVSGFRSSAQLRPASSLPTASWGSDRRSLIDAAGVQCGESQGEVADRQFHPALRKDRKGSRASQQDDSATADILQVGRQEHVQSVPRFDPSTYNLDLLSCDVLTKQKLPRHFALDIFAGTARISRAVHSSDSPMYPIDTCLFPSHNVLLPSVEQKIFHWIRTGKVWLIWLGMPCTKFSRARKHDGLGPGPLRDDTCLWGLPGLSSYDRHKVSDGNALFFFTLRVLQMCVQYHIPFVLENPLSSMVWLLPPLHKFVEQSQAQYCDLDYCPFGELWKKPTRLLYHMIDLSSMSTRCTGKSNICSLHRRPHVRLTGRDDCNVFLTLKAQPYPWRLCQRFANLASTLRG